MNDIIRELAPENSNDEVEDILKKDFQDVMWHVLMLLEVDFPHKKGDGSYEEKQFNTIRPKILRAGNDKIRNLESLLDSYAILKVQEYKPVSRPDIQIDIMDFRNKFKINQINKGGRDDNERGSSK